MTKNLLELYTEFATLISFTAHEGQLYGRGPFFNHHVQLVVRKTYELFRDTDLNTPESHQYLLQIAYLHDVVEDTNVSFATLEELGFSEVVLDALELLTNQLGHDRYDEYMDTLLCSNNPYAITVKLADNRVNAASDKSHMSPEKRDRLTKKYEKAYDQLLKKFNLLVMPNGF